MFRPNPTSEHNATACDRCQSEYPITQFCGCLCHDRDDRIEAES